MSFTVINNEAAGQGRRSGFRNGEFKQLASLYSRSNARKLIFDMAVDVDFDEGVGRFSYYRTANAPPWLTFAVRQVGPNANMYELWGQGKGLILKSGLFSRVFEKLSEEIDALDPNAERPTYQTPSP